MLGRDLRRVVLVENTGAELGSLRRQVPAYRRKTFRFFSTPPETTAQDIGQSEARAVMSALTAAPLLSRRRPHDLIFKVTARYYVYDFEQLVRLHACI